MGDEEFLRAVDECVDMLYNLARRLTPSRAEAQDLVQETYLQALRGWRRQPPDQVRPWLATICLNLARAGYRRRAARPAELLDPHAGTTTASTSDTAGQALAAVTSAVVHDALWQLPAAQREAVTLMDLCGFTAAQAAAMLGVPRGTVLARVHRGHQRLAGLLHAERVIDGDA